MTDIKLKRIIEKAQGGDETSFQALYEYYYQKAYYLALKITNNEADAKDVVQETFIQIHRSLPSLRDLSLFSSWMNKIVISKCNRIFTKRKHTVLDPDIIKESSVFVESSIEGNPRQSMKKKTDQEILLKLLSQMKPKHREVLVLMYLCEMKQQEIAELLEININTLKSRVMYAKEELQYLVRQYEKDNDYHFDFQIHTIGTVLSLAFVMEMQALGIGSAGASSLSILCMKAGSFMQTHAVSLLTCAVIAGTTVAVNSAIHDPSPDISKPLNVSTQGTEYQPESFPPVTYQGKTYDNSKDAYFALVNWANTETMIQHKSNEEKQEARKLLSALQQADNTYYQMLVDQNIHLFLK